MNTKTPTYDWRCRNCDAVNVAHTSVCAACGFDTINCYPPSQWAQMRGAGVPAWRRVIVLLFGGAGAIVGVVGFFLLTQVYFLTDIEGMAWSGLATLIGGGLFSIAQKCYPENN
jgi:ribosomal protein L37E